MTRATVLGAGVWTPSAPTLADFLAARAPEPGVERREVFGTGPAAVATKPAAGSRGAFGAGSSRESLALPAFAAVANSAKPDAQLLPARMRGRASLLTAMFANVVEQAARAAGMNPSALPTLFGSAYGEMGTIRALLAQLWAAEELSPARFQASVHNTAAGQLSIALGNRNFSSSIAAGRDTLAMLWIEALAWLHEHPGALLLACADEGPSPELQPGLDYPPLAAAWVVSNTVDVPGVARLGAVTPARAAAEGGEPGGNPCAGALALVRAMYSGEGGAFALSRAFQLEVVRS